MTSGDYTWGVTPDSARPSASRQPLDIVTVPAETQGAGASGTPLSAGSARVSYRTLQRMVREGRKIAALTCYDAVTAGWLDRAGIPMLLVGDTAAEMVLGLPGTIHAPLDFMVLITAAVRRGAPRAFVMADMPFMSYQASADAAMQNAGRFLTEGGADAVKLEVDRSFLPLIDRMSHAGIPVVAHLGCRPQHVKRTGGYTGAGRTAADAMEIVEAACACDRAGAAMILLEAVPDEVSKAVTERVNVPVIGCGAGPSCHGQIIVLHDLLGLTSWQPAFAPPMARMGDVLTAAAQAWHDKVGASGPESHPYRLDHAEAQRFRDRLAGG